MSKVGKEPIGKERRAALSFMATTLTAHHGASLAPRAVFTAPPTPSRAHGNIAGLVSLNLMRQRALGAM
jgi:hypothetical protein